MWFKWDACPPSDSTISWPSATFTRQSVLLLHYICAAYSLITTLSLTVLRAQRLDPQSFRRTCRQHVTPSYPCYARSLWAVGLRIPHPVIHLCMLFTCWIPHRSTALKRLGDQNLFASRDHASLAAAECQLCTPLAVLFLSSVNHIPSLCAVFTVNCAVCRSSLVTL